MSLLGPHFNFSPQIPRPPPAAIRDLLVNCSTEGGGSAGGDLACSAARKKGIRVCSCHLGEAQLHWSLVLRLFWSKEHQVTYTNLGPGLDPKQLPAGPGEQSLASKGNSIPGKGSAMRKF